MKELIMGIPKKNAIGALVSGTIALAANVYVVCSKYSEKTEKGYHGFLAGIDLGIISVCIARLAGGHNE